MWGICEGVRCSGGDIRIRRFGMGGRQWLDQRLHRCRAGAASLHRRMPSARGVVVRVTAQRAGNAYARRACGHAEMLLHALTSLSVIIRPPPHHHPPSSGPRGALVTGPRGLGRGGGVTFRTRGGPWPWGAFHVVLLRVPITPQQSPHRHYQRSLSLVIGVIEPSASRIPQPRRQCPRALSPNPPSASASSIRPRPRIRWSLSASSSFPHRHQPRPRSCLSLDADVVIFTPRSASLMI